MPSRANPPPRNRRSFDRATKRRILDAYDSASSEDRKALLEREGIYHSHISAWRNQLAGPKAVSSGPPRRPRRAGPINPDRIIEAAIEVLEQKGGEHLTMSDVADRLGVAPMSLYRHFRSHDELLSEVAWTLLGRQEMTSRRAGPWEERLAHWMLSAHDAAVAYPQLTHLVASGASPAWLVNSAELLAILELAGVREDAELARVSYWIATTVMGHAMVRALTPDNATTRQVSSALARLNESDAARVARVLPGMAELQPKSFEVVVDYVVAALPHVTELERMGDGQARPEGHTP